MQVFLRKLNIYLKLYTQRNYYIKSLLDNIQPTFVSGHHSSTTSVIHYSMRLPIRNQLIKLENVMICISVLTICSVLISRVKNHWTAYKAKCSSFHQIMLRYKKSSLRKRHLTITVWMLHFVHVSEEEIVNVTSFRWTEYNAVVGMDFQWLLQFTVTFSVLVLFLYTLCDDSKFNNIVRYVVVAALIWNANCWQNVKTKWNSWWANTESIWRLSIYTYGK